nr:protein RepA [Providencia rettgeri]
MDKKEIIELTGSIVDNNKLTMSTSSSIQPAILLRLGVFVPQNKTKVSTKENVVDVSKAFSTLEFARNEGYDDISIQGLRMSVAVDFRVWMGVIHAFSKYGFKSNKITLPFIEFVKMCNYESRQINKLLRNRVFNSLNRIGTNTVSFKQKNGEKMFFTHLLKTARFDPDQDVIELEADQKLWEIYQVDHNILVRKAAYFELVGKEVAQTLYIYLSSLPDNFAPISFTRLRNRLNLKSEVKEQNRLIKAALLKLKEINYIDYSIVKKGRENNLIVHTRNKKTVHLS